MKRSKTEEENKEKIGMSCNQIGLECMFVSPHFVCERLLFFTQMSRQIDALKSFGANSAGRSIRVTRTVWHSEITSRNIKYAK